MDNQSKIKKRRISVETKEMILSRLAQGEGTIAIGKEFGFSESAIRSLKKRHSLTSTFNYSSSAPKARQKNIFLEKMEEELVLWIQNTIKKQITIDKDMIKEEAIKFYVKQQKDPILLNSSSQSSGPKFFASDTWLKNFIKRHELTNLTGNSEKACNDSTEVSKTCDSNVLTKNADDIGFILLKQSKSKPKKTISLETKNTILNRIAEGEKCPDIGRELGFSESTIRRIKNRASQIRNILIEKLEEKLVIWVQKLNQKKFPISRHLIQIKARQLFKELKRLEPCSSSSEMANVNFSASDDWFNDFIRRHALHKLKIAGEVSSANSTLTKKSSQNLTIVDDSNDTESVVTSSDGGTEESDEVFKDDKDPIDEENLSSMTADKIYEGLQLGLKLENILIGKMEEKLAVWVQELNQKKDSIDRYLIQKEAEKLFTKLKNLKPCKSSSQITNVKFSANDVWFRDFIRRYALDNFDIKDEVSLVNSSLTKNSSQNLTNVSGIDDEESDKVLKVDNNPMDIEENLGSMTAEKIYEGLQLCDKLQEHFLAIDSDLERSLKFQNELRNCISGYRDIYKRIVNQP